MRLLKRGSAGASVELLQLALNRAGFGALDTDGLFGGDTERALKAFQRQNGLASDGIAGRESHRALLPWYTGYLVHTLSQGDSLYAIARGYGSSLEAILNANPGLVPENLRPGSSITVPLGFPVVPEGISCSSRLVAYCVRGLSARYPFIRVGEAGRSVMGRP